MDVTATKKLAGTNSMLDPRFRNEAEPVLLIEDDELGGS